MERQQDHPRPLRSRGLLTKEHFGICTGGDPNMDSGHSEEEHSCQSIAKEDQIPVVACKA